MVTQLLLAAALAMHPLHTTMTEVTIDEPHRTMRATIRVFADDVRAAAGAVGVDAYVAKEMRLMDGRRELRMASCGSRRAGDVLFLCVEARFAGSVADLRLTDTLLCDRFSDQVNVVQVDNGGRRSSLLFTRGDHAKAMSGGR